MSAALNLLLAALLLGLAVWAVLSRGAFAAVTGFIAYGLLLALAWVQLQGIDIALTEAAIGGGLTGAMLINAARRLRHTEASAHAQTPTRLARGLAMLLSLGVSVALCWSVLTLPEPAPSLATAVRAQISATEVGNPITAVLLGFRAMDTLLEAIVLLFALIGVWSLSADRHWGGRPGLRQQADAQGLFAFAARLLAPLGLVVGVYIFWIGADHPGGKFQAATLLAAMWLLVLMAGLADAPPIGRRWLRALLVLGPLSFIAVGVLGAATAGAFLAYPAGWAKPLILLIEFALMPTLTLILALMLLGTAQRGQA